MKLSFSPLRSLALAVAALALVAFLLPASIAAQGPPAVPHSVEGREDCLSCHETGVGGAPQFPQDHAGRTNAMCSGCHTTSAPSAAPIPKESDSCFNCHKALGGRHEAIAFEWEESIHATRQVGCASCHGGDPSQEYMGTAMSPEAGFIGVPPRTQIPELCASCHADVTLMRQYDLPVDQLVKYRESKHGQRLAQGDTNVATCYDCHGGHNIKPPEDPTSSVYVTNVPRTCARCHSDEALMRPYGIATNQYELYKESVHGVALLERQDRRAPNCADCHGTHGAAPPGFAEVQNVCGKCHAATQEYYLQGAHFQAGVQGPKCVTCHGRYDVQPATEEMFLGDGPRHCGSCHPPESSVGKMVESIYKELSGAANAIAQAQDAVNRAEANRMIQVQEKEQLLQAQTYLTEARAVQHMAELVAIREKTSQAKSIAEEVSQHAEQAISEAMFRRRAMVVAVVLISLTVGALWVVKREIDRSHSR